MIVGVDVGWGIRKNATGGVGPALPGEAAAWGAIRALINFQEIFSVVTHG